MKKAIFKIINLALVLTAILALTATGCKGKPETVSSAPISAESTEVGEGSKSFEFTVEADGSVKQYTVKTDKETVGEALLEVGLIEGDRDQYGLYVKKVDGIRADYELDKAYWAFYEDGKYASAGVDLTEIKDGVKYAFKKEKS